jgi:hypothetical protein
MQTTQENQRKEAEVKIIGGKEIKSRWGQWYRHDRIKLDGVELEGFIQVRRRYFGKRLGHRIEAITCYKDGCIIGSDWLWLARQNGFVIQECFQRYYNLGKNEPRPAFKE